MWLGGSFCIIQTLLLILSLPSKTQAIQCYICSHYEPLTTPLPLTADNLESLAPSTCKTNLTQSNSAVECIFKIWINSDPDNWHSSTLTRKNTVYIDLNGLNENNFVRQEERIELSIAATQMSSRSIRNDLIIYYCSEDKCNTFENMKRVLNATTSDFDFDQVMVNLAANRTVTLDHPIAYDYYQRNELPSINNPPCFACHVPSHSSNSSATSCIKAEARKCGDYVCGACFWAIPTEQDKWAEFSHHDIYWSNSRIKYSSFWYTCTLPNCNTEKKREEIQSLYTMKFDVTKFAGEIISSTTINPNNNIGVSLRNDIIIVISLLVYLFFHYA